MTTRKLLWLETHEDRDVPLKGLAKDLIDDDIEFLKDIWTSWED